jgi:hypothetical protein
MGDIDEYGDEKLTHLLRTLARYPKSHSMSTHDGCKMVYEGFEFYNILRAG